MPPAPQPGLLHRPRPVLRRRLLALGAAIGLLTGLLPAAAALPVAVAAAGQTLPAGFVDQAIRTGLTRPTVVAFAPGGRVFVAEKSGIVKTWASYAAFAGATAPATTIDLSTDVYDYWDRGLLGLAVDPKLLTGRPYIYLLYSAESNTLGGAVPLWASDTCRSSPGGPGATVDGCVAYGRLARVTVNTSTGVATGSPTTLIEGWCQQFPSHSIGTVAVGPDGMLYVGSGDGASFGGVGDYGQFGGTVIDPATSQPFTPANPCADPPGAAGAPLTAPTAEGGGLRSQGARRASTEPVSLDGSILRVNPDTGLAAADNPFVASTNLNKRRIVAYGLRNPFRFIVQPGTGDLWIGDVGYNTWEEVDHAANPAGVSAGSVQNFGWPCYEGTHANTYFGATTLDLCNGFGQAPVFYTYSHGAVMAPGDACPVPSTSSVAGLAFYGGTAYPAAYQNGLFVADYSRRCLTFIGTGASGQPDATKVMPFGAGMLNPVNLTGAPDNGDIVYPDFDNGAIRRIRYLAPTAAFTVTPDQGTAPLDVALDASGSTGSAGTTLVKYQWDFNGDDTYDETDPSPTTSHQFPQGSWQVRLRVTDSNGVTAETTHQVDAGNTAPSVTIGAPAPSLTWSVGDAIPFSASATDTQDGSLPASAYSWSFQIIHCIDPNDQTTCHVHLVETIPSTGHPTPITAGSWDAPDHEYPSHLRISVTVTDSGNLTATKSVDIFPKTSTVAAVSDPPGAPITIDGDVTSGPVTVIRGHATAVAAPSTFESGGVTYLFEDWSDGGGQSHTISATPAATTLTATYRQAPSAVTFTTTPISTPIEVNGSPVDSGTAMDFSPGSQVQVKALSPVIVGESTYDFASWSDGGALDHDYLVPSGPSTLTASYVLSGGVGGVTDQPDTCSSKVGYSRPGSTWQGRVGTATDVDWFRFAVTSTRTYRILLRDLPVDARLDLYRGCSSRIASSDAAGLHWEELLPRLISGTYALKVSGKGASDLGLYGLRVTPLAESAVVIGSRSRTDAAGRLRIVGEVLNNTAYRRGPIRVTARLYDAAGHRLATRTVSVDRPVVAARTRVPFRIVGSLPAGLHHVTFSVSAPRTSGTPVNLSVGGVTAVADGADWRVSGSLTNRHTYRVTGARALVTIYDLNGLILDTASVAPTDATLSRGETRPFVVTFSEPGLPPAETRVRGSARI